MEKNEEELMDMNSFLEQYAPANSSDCYVTYTGGTTTANYHNAGEFANTLKTNT